VKLSAPFRTSAQPFPHADVDPFVAAIMDVFGVGRCVWGSDWPFINTSQQVEYRNLLTRLTRWLPNPADREEALWHNPARFFGFAASA
jgi:predicted TIM-barrel fold metal-dependent hydrolase